MRLKEHKLEKKEDYTIFKCLVRAMKEDNKFISLSNKELKKRGQCVSPLSYQELIERCYASRKTHSAESFETNIFYWPQDAITSLTDNGRLLYYMLLIKELDSFNQKRYSTIANYFISAVKSQLIKPKLNKFPLKYSNLIVECLNKVDADVKCDKDELLNILNVISEGNKECIPF